MYYSVTIEKIREALPGQAQFTELQCGYPPDRSYLLWMCDEIQKMETNSLDSAIKAGRWMGWVLAHIELCGVWDNNTTRDYVREDRLRGFDRPH